MPLFFFDITEGVCALDPTGIMLPDTRAARHQAIVYASERLDDDAALAEDWLIEVKDDLDSVLFSLTFSPRPTTVRPRLAACG